MTTSIRNFAMEFKPKKFCDLIGNQEVISVVKEWISSNNIPPAILITGEMGAGKSLLAELLTRASICLNRKPDEIEPCGSCAPCRGQGIKAIIGSRVPSDQFLEDVRLARCNGSRTMSWMYEGDLRW